MKAKTANKWTNTMSRLHRLSILVVFLCIGSLTAFAQKSVRGSVTDANGEPLAGVSVLADLDGKKTGTVTDIDGNYSLTVPGGGNSRV